MAHELSTNELGWMRQEHVNTSYVLHVNTTYGLGINNGLAAYQYRNVDAATPYVLDALRNLIQ